MASEAPAQMTLDVGADPGYPMSGTFKIGGSLVAALELPKGADVRITVTDTDGQIVSSVFGYVASVAFKDHRSETAPTWTERIHGIALV